MNKLQMPHLLYSRLDRTADGPGCEREHGASQRVGRDALLPGAEQRRGRKARQELMDDDN